VGVGGGAGAGAERIAGGRGEEGVSGESFFIVGGAGFIGSHFTDRLLADPGTRRVTLYDNFSSGRAWHYEQHVRDRRLRVVRGDVHDFGLLRESMAGHDTVIHLASNPDIARAVREPDVDFREGTELTHLVVEAMRQTGTRSILYASAAGSTASWGRWRRARTTPRWCRCRPTAPASWPARR
jgi:UDP-glucose 4-epimerase